MRRFVVYGGWIDLSTSRVGRAGTVLLVGDGMID